MRSPAFKMKLPKGITPKVAKQEIMVEFDVKKYDSVWIPLPRIFYLNWVAPRLYSQVNNIRLQAGHKDNGD